MLKLLLCVTCLLITNDVVQCQSEMYKFNPELSGWVALHEVPATWEEAYLRCHFEGATLASPIDNNMTSVLHKIISDADKGQPFFVGTHALFSTGDFFSVEGVPLNNMPLRIRQANRDHDESWLPPTESHSSEPGACLTMAIDGSVSYVYISSCTERHPYVCYKKMKNESLNRCGTFDNNYRYNERTGSCYKLHQDYQKWSRANMICAAEGGYLVILNNAEEAQYVKELFPEKNRNGDWQPLLLGMRAWSSDRIWLTNHGESLERNFNSWASGQPDNSQNRQACGALLRSGKLDDVWCELKAIFVCEKDPLRLMFEAANDK